MLEPIVEDESGGWVSPSKSSITDIFDALVDDVHRGVAKVDVMSPFWDIITLQHFRVLCLPK